MKSIFTLGLLMLTFSSFAQNAGSEGPGNSLTSKMESLNDKGRMFKKIKSASGVELRKELNSLYEKNFLNK